MSRKIFLVTFSMGLAAATVLARKVLAPVQSPIVGGGCDGCELIYEGMPQQLTNITYMPDWKNDRKQLIVEGTVYHKDKITVAPNVIVYLYHTDSKGYYSTSPGQTAGKRHGQLRGWIKTGADGKYRFYTTMPAAYPGRGYAGTHTPCN